MESKIITHIGWHPPAAVPRLVFAVATYELPPAEELLSQLHRIFEELIAPNAKGRDDITLLASFCQVGTERWQYSKPNDINWKQIADYYPALLTVMLDCMPNRDKYRPPEVAILAANIRENTEEANTVEAHISISDLLGGRVSLDFQTKLVQAVGELYTAINGVNGFITIDTDMSASCVGLGTPYERSGGVSYLRASRTFRERLRGYFWGNFLSKQHIELLGGESNMQAAPAKLIRKMSGDSYYLQLTDDINDVDNSALDRLRVALEPVLPKSRR